jgi:heme oxygenase-like protein
MLLPRARGPKSAAVCRLLRGDTQEYLGAVVQIEPETEPPFPDEDSQLALWILYELHYGGFDDIDDRWEWQPSAIAVRAELEASLESHLRSSTAYEVDRTLRDGGDLPDRLFAMVARSDGSSSAAYLQRYATRAQMVEFLVERTVYHLKEADPHTWAIPRLRGAAKAALVELQYDEYGAGSPTRLHAEMFRDTLEECGLDSRYGAYIDAVDATTLLVNNTMSLFGLHRRLRGAAVGHLAAFEATSSLPARRVAGGLRRLGFSDRAAAYFDEHVEADAVHEQIAMRVICGELVKDDPEQIRNVVFGAAACLWVDQLAASALLERWNATTVHASTPHLAGVARGR